LFGDILLTVLVLGGIAVVAVTLNKRLLTLLLSSLFLLLVAVRLNVPQMYLMGAVLLALPAASWLVGWLSVRGLSVTRTVPAAVSEGDEAVFSADVHSRYPLFSGLARVGRHLPRHLRLVPGSERIEPTVHGIRQEYRVVAMRRGVYSLGAPRVSVMDPLGVFALSRRFPMSDTLIVYPRGLEEPVRESLRGSSGGWLVTATEGRPGDESGFYGTREYRVGDDLRRIHWKSSARVGEPVVVEREHGASGCVWLALETRRDSGGGVGRDRTASFETAVRVAVSMMENAMGQGMSVALLAGGDSGALIPPGMGESHRHRILEALARVQPEADEDLARNLNIAALDRGSTVVAITCAPTGELLDALGMLRARGMGIAAAAVVPLPGAVEPPFPTIEAASFAAEVDRLGGGTLVVPAQPVPGRLQPAPATNGN
jgi:uncharacterized protein (DUF58 family)